MSSVAPNDAPSSENGATRKPEDLYKKTLSPAERRRIAAEVLQAYSPRISAWVRRTLPQTPKHWAEAEQEGAKGLCEALASWGGQTDFWPFAFTRIRDAIRQWKDVGIYWRKQTNRGKDAKRQAAREAAKASMLHVEYQADVDYRLDSASPEKLLGDAEEQALVLEFASVPSEQPAIFLSEDPRACHRKILVEQARAAFAKGACR